jgi:hypothetical protein
VGVEGADVNALSAATGAAQAGARGLFGGIARLRRDRSLHPAGIAFAATLTVDRPLADTAGLFGERAEHEAFVRFSRGFGLPEPLPEILSLAVKVPGVGQDLLLTATGDRPVLRHLFWAGRSHLVKRYSSVFPFRVGRETVVLGARPLPAPRSGRDLEELESAAARNELELELEVARPLGSWRPVARLTAGRRLGPAEEDALEFNSDNAGGGIEPAGFVNRVRGAAYAASIRGRRS